MIKKTLDQKAFMARIDEMNDIVELNELHAKLVKEKVDSIIQFFKSMVRKTDADPEDFSGATPGDR